jgi:hypothetical protein
METMRNVKEEKRNVTSLLLAGMDDEAEETTTSDHQKRLGSRSTSNAIETVRKF